VIRYGAPIEPVEGREENAALIGRVRAAIAELAGVPVGEGEVAAEVAAGDSVETQR
jgi:hypothetical protein